MDDDHDLILVAAYEDLESARFDFHELQKRIKHGLELRGAALITKNADGEPEVVEAANRHGRVGAGVGAGLGILFGLFVPPLGLSVLVGAAAGALVASFADHEVRSGLRHEVAEALEAGTGVVLTLVYPNGRSQVQSTLTKASSLTPLRMDRTSVDSLETAVAEAVKNLPHQGDSAVNAGTPDTST